VLSRRLVQPLLAGPFIVGGIDAFRSPGSRAAKAESIGPALAKRLGLPEDPETLVKINAAVMVGAGTLLALGKAPRLAAIVLLGSLVPTTIAGHPFWDESDPVSRKQQRTQFLKNAAMAGGLVLAALDTEGRPSVRWRATRAARRAGEKLPVGH
jgi:putative oxidoreductase